MYRDAIDFFFNINNNSTIGVSGDKCFMDITHFNSSQTLLYSYIIIPNNKL